MPEGFEIARPTRLFQSLDDYRAKGALRGVYLGYPNMQDHYTMSTPGVTDWTGFPRSGKTELVMDLLFNASQFYGWKHLVWVPDKGDTQEVIADIVHKLTGKTFDKRYANHINSKELADALPWVEEHFRIVHRRDPRKRLSPYEFWEWAAELKQEGELHTATIDAWKDMSHAKEREIGRTDQYLEDVLSYRNSMAEQHKLHFHTIVHPTRTQVDSAGKRKPPTPYDMKGGTEWYNNGKNMVTVHRPDGDDTTVEVYFNKIKPRSIGSVGMVTLKFDPVKLAYYIDEEGTRHYADSNYQKLKSVAQKEAIFEEDDEIPF